MRGFAVQARVNLETIGADGTVRPTGGVLKAFEPAAGPGVRTDTYASTGYPTNPSFDSLLAKVIGHAATDDVGDALDRTSRALGELRIEGVATNVPFLQAILAHPDVRTGLATTDFVDRTWLSSSPWRPPRPRPRASSEHRHDSTGRRRRGCERPARRPQSRQVGRRLLVRLPGASTPTTRCSPRSRARSSRSSVVAGDSVRVGQPLLVMEAMKMEHVIESTMSGVVAARSRSRSATRCSRATRSSLVEQTASSARLPMRPRPSTSTRSAPTSPRCSSARRSTLDAARPDAVASAVATQPAHRPGEHRRPLRRGLVRRVRPLVIAAQRRRRTLDELIARTRPTAWSAASAGSTATCSPTTEARCIVMSYDYTVLAGTQGMQNHRKKDRLFELAERLRLPVVFFTEGGGGRPGDTDGIGRRRARLHGVQPVRRS